MKKTSLNIAKARLALLWAIGFVVLFIFFFIQTVTGRYIGIVNEAWGWFSSHFLSSLTLILGGYFFESKTNTRLAKKIPATHFIIAFSLSLLYFFVAFIILFSYRRINGNILEYYQSYNIVLGLLQATLSTSVIFLFTKEVSE